MPSVAENRDKWTKHDWTRGGHEWSPGGTAEGTDLLWWRSILPRLHAWLPAGTLLEIAPGLGRWTSYLSGHCARLIGVDVTQHCVDVCRGRFASRPGAEFHLNDGESIPMLADASIDLAFSFDSLVHVERDQVQAYLFELARTLKPGGAAFLHHSNLGAYAEASSDRIPDWVTKRHWRAASMSASAFREGSRAAGLRCVSQEVINWIGRGARADRFRLPGGDIALTDCISIVVKPADRQPDPPTRLHVNRRFVDEWRELLVLATMYADHDQPGSDDGSPAVTAGRPATPQRREGVLARLSRRRAGLVERREGRKFRRREAIASAVAAGTCPDCGGRLSAARCSTCRVAFTLA